MDSLILHVASGDIAMEALRRRGLSTIIPWREALADGPVVAWAEDLFARRRHFVVEAYDADIDQYSAMIEEPFREITTKRWDAVHLHFDTDLFCCVNLMFLVTHLRHVPELVWWIRDQQYPLSLLDRVFLHSCWHAYAGDDPRILEGLIEQAPRTLQRFIPAVRAHLERFPDVHTGIGRPMMIITELNERGIHDDDALVSAFIAIDENRYGWGDRQIMREAKLLRQIRSGSAVTMELGGCRLDLRSPVWRWDAVKGHIIGRDTGE
ncbi:MAG: hypothetical protein RIR53_31 [Bacteroidota bacterium]|jgi:hypothetical protein